MTVEAWREQLAELVAANAIVEERIKKILELARAIDAGDRDGSGVLLDAAEVCALRFGRRCKILRRFSAPIHAGHTH